MEIALTSQGKLNPALGAVDPAFIGAVAPAMQSCFLLRCLVIVGSRSYPPGPEMHGS